MNETGLVHKIPDSPFVWPSAKDGMVSLTSSQLACLLDGIDWRNPQYSWRPASAG